MCTTNNNKKAKKKYTHPPLEDSSKLEDFTCLEYSERLIDYEGNIGYSNEGFPVDVVGIDFGNRERMFLPANNYEVNIKLQKFGEQITLTIRASNLATGECKVVTQSHICHDTLQNYPSQFLSTKRETKQKHPMNHLQSYYKPLENQFWNLQLSSYDEPKIISSDGGIYKQKVIDELTNYAESTIDGLAYTISALGGSINGGFKAGYNDFKYNGKWAGYGRPYPGKYASSYAYGFSFENGFTAEKLDRGPLSWTNGKRVMNGTIGILLFPVQLGRTSYGGLNFLIDQVITNGIGYGVGKGLDRISNQ